MNALSGIFTRVAQRNGLLSRTSTSLQSTRKMSGGHHGEAVTYEGVTLHRPSKFHRYAGETMAGIMWFWIFFRAYHDGSTLLFGHAQHFEHEAHEDGHHEE